MTDKEQKQETLEKSYERIANAVCDGDSAQVNRWTVAWIAERLQSDPAFLESLPLTKELRAKNEILELDLEMAKADAKYHLPPCNECGAKTLAEARVKCRCGGDKDDCHGQTVWPDGGEVEQQLEQIEHLQSQLEEANKKLAEAQALADARLEQMNADRRQYLDLKARLGASEPVGRVTDIFGTAPGSVVWGGNIPENGTELFTAPPDSAGKVPEGYALVPIEPTPKMIDATWAHEIDKNGGIESQNTRNKRIYKAMIFVAPQPPSDTVGAEGEGKPAWQPIDKLPRKGKVVAVDFGRHGVHAAYWHQPGNHKLPGYWVIFNGSHFKTAYGWANLPSAPTQQQANGEVG